MQERCKEEDKDARAGVKSERMDPLPLFTREWIDGMCGNLGDALIFRRSIKIKIR